MKRGTKPLPAAKKVLRGTFQPCRARAAVVVPVEAPLGPPPAWLKGSALRLWGEKTAIYARRGQSVVGCESALAQYCQVEADLIRRWQHHADIPVALINAHRIYANEFYDTPASQQGAQLHPRATNRFAQNGRRPAS